MKELPLISVCIPVYNGEKYISEAIESVLNQTFENFELLIIDNKSTDNTFNILQGYLKKHPKKIRILQNSENLGFEANWNKCLSLAKGKYIKILPSDDYIYPSCLENQINAFSKSEKIVLVCSKRNIVDSKGKKLFSRGFKGRSKLLENRVVWKKIIRSGGNLIGEPGSVLFKSEIAKLAGKFDTSIFYVVDLDYWFRLLLYGDLYFISEILSTFRISTDSSSVKKFRSQSQDCLKWYNKIFREKKFGIGKIDLLIGTFRVRIAEIIKFLIYKIVLN